MYVPMNNNTGTNKQRRTSYLDIVQPYLQAAIA